MMNEHDRKRLAIRRKFLREVRKDISAILLKLNGETGRHYSALRGCEYDDWHDPLGTVLHGLTAALGKTLIECDGLDIEEID